MTIARRVTGRLFLFALAGLLAAAAGCSARVKVLDATTDGPIKGARVSFQNFADEELGAATTGRNGVAWGPRAVIADRARVTITGYQPAAAEFGPVLQWATVRLAPVEMPLTQPDAGSP
ncbi:MAG: hypothetical protein BIFFINMI_01780 [Phycisphaerae bacterium]|nr:hypothetical protein [Phycisphaerae bacterium]